MSATTPARPEQSRRAFPDHSEHSRKEPSVRPELVEGHSLCKHLPLIVAAPGGIKKLRELILELAVRGKLVPQDPNDEPASELLGRCEAEKARLITEKMIRQSKPLPSISEEEKRFALPLGWEWVRIGQVAHPQAGFAFKSQGFNEVGAGLPLIRIRDVGQSISTTYYDGDYRNEFLVEPGDYLISMDGQFRVAAWGGTPGLLNQRVTRLVFFGTECTPAFVAASLQEKLALLQGVKAYTTVDHLSGKQIAEGVIGLPPAVEQHRIVAKVNELMALCDRLEAQQADAEAAHATLVKTLLDTLTQSQSAEDFAANWQRLSAHFDTLFTTEPSIDALKQTLLQLAVMGKLVPQDPNDESASELLERIQENKARVVMSRKKKKEVPLPEISLSAVPFDLPNGWAWCRFAEVTEIQAKLVRPEKYPEYPQVGPDCIEKGTGRLIQRRTVRESGVRGPNYSFSAGQLLYSKIRPSLSKAVLVDFGGLCSADMYPLDVHILPQFLLFELLSEHFRVQVMEAENRVKMPKLNQEDLGLLRVAVPPLGEQRRIIAKLEEFLALCDRLKGQLTDSRTVHERLADALAARVTAS